MSEAKGLRDLLLRHLGGSIGTYLLPNGRKVEAIAVIKASEIYPPAGSQVTGLEVVLVYPRPILNTMLDAYCIEQEWTIHLKQWDKTQSLDVLLPKLLKLNNIKRLISVPADERLGTPATITAIYSTFERMG